MDFFKRNAPIIIIGVVTLIIFLGIIIAGQKNGPSNQPSLTEKTEENLITNHTYTLGSVDAPITIIEFSDFQCPACQAFQPIVRSLYDAHPDKIRLAYRHFPLPQHPYARKAAEAAQIAGEQGKFWEYADKLFANNTNLTNEDLIKYAGELNLDTTKFKSQLDSGDFAKIINEDIKTATDLKLNSTPSFFLNNKLMSFTTPQDFEDQVLQAVDNVDRGTSSIQNINNETKETKESSTPVDIKYGVLQINYTDKGFNPKNSTGYVGQMVKVTNTTNKVITFEQTEFKFQQIGSERPVQPGESFEFRINAEGQWNFREKESKDFGSTFIYRPELQDSSQK